MVQRLKSEGKRESIMDAAIEVIATEGVHSATTRKIAAKAGVNLGTLHYHFENKEAILLSILSYLATDSRGHLERRFSNNEKLHNRIEHLLQFIWSAVQKNPHEQVTLFDLTLYALTTKGSGWLAKKKYDEYLLLYREPLATAVDVRSGAVKVDIDALANFIFTSFVGIVLQWLATKNTKRARQEVLNLISSAQHLARH